MESTSACFYRARGQRGPDIQFSLSHMVPKCSFDQPYGKRTTKPWQHEGCKPHQNTIMTPEWRKFLNWPFSWQARFLLENARIESIDQLAQMPIEEMRKYRNVGNKAIAELRAALAHFDYKLAGDVSQSAEATNDLGVLEREQIELEFRLRGVKAKIKTIKANIPSRRKLTSRVFSRWLNTRDLELVAQEFSLTAARVRRIVNDAYRRKFSHGELDVEEICDTWKRLKNDAAVCKKYDLPDYVLHNLRRRTRRTH